MKILVVEDEVLIAEGIEMSLSAIGHQVVGIARDLGEAVGLARELGPEMAFVDIKLARGSCGLDVARELTALGITCVFATANPPDPNHAKGLGLGYILKPFSHRLLEQTAAYVGRVLNGENGAPAGFQYL